MGIVTHGGCNIPPGVQQLGCLGRPYGGENKCKTLPYLISRLPLSLANLSALRTLRYARHHPANLPQCLQLMAYRVGPTTHTHYHTHTPHAYTFTVCYYAPQLLHIALPATQFTTHAYHHRRARTCNTVYPCSCGLVPLRMPTEHFCCLHTLRRRALPAAAPSSLLPSTAPHTTRARIATHAGWATAAAACRAAFSVPLGYLPRPAATSPTHLPQAALLTATSTPHYTPYRRMP